LSESSIAVNAVLNIPVENGLGGAFAVTGEHSPQLHAQVPRTALRTTTRPGSQSTYSPLPAPMRMRSRPQEGQVWVASSGSSLVSSRVRFGGIGPRP
jgi:hypothetical protein